MRTRFLLVPLLLALAVSGALAAPPGTAFELVQLKHLTACEIAPLLGSQFRLAGEPTRPASAGRSAAREFAGISLITAAHPSSRYLLAAGTAEGVAELRGFVALLDGPRPRVQVRAEVYPAPPAQMTGWARLAEVGGLQVLGHAIPAGAKLRFPPLPPDFSPTVIEVSEAAGAAEFLPLPAFGNFPQVVLGVAADLGKRQMRLGVGVLSEQSSPAWAAEAAANLRYTLSMRAGESIGLMLLRGKAAVTVVVRVEGE